MSENNYGALMMKSTVGSSDDINAILSPGIYPIPPANTSSPDSSGGMLTIHSGSPVRRTFTSDSIICLTSTRNGNNWTAWRGPLARTNPFADIKSDGTITEALENLGLKDVVNALIKTNNLSDLPDKALSRTNLGVPKGIDKQMVNEWAVFNGTGTVTIGDSIGISSITRTAVGSYTVVLSKPYASPDYAIAGRWTANLGRDHELEVLPNRTASSFQLYCASDSSNLYPSTDAVDLAFLIVGVK